VLDARVRPWIDPLLNRVAVRLAKLGLGANFVTVVGFLLGILGCVAIVFEFYQVALSFILLNRIGDGLDGALARRTGPSDLGGYLDIVLDTLFYSAVPFAFALARPENLLPAAFLIYSFVGTGGSFLAYAIIAAKRKMTTECQGKKSFFYSVGLMEGTETILFFLAFCMFPERFGILAWVFGGLCWGTTLLRICSATVAFSAPKGLT
jgi:phosphatidylglycerophosphate synthase